MATTNASDLSALTDVEVVSEWLGALKSGNPADATRFLLESERRGSKRISKAFEAINAKK